MARITLVSYLVKLVHSQRNKEKVGMDEDQGHLVSTQGEDYGKRAKNECHIGILRSPSQP